MKRNIIQKRVVAFSLATAISLNMSPLVLADTEEVVAQEIPTAINVDANAEKIEEALKIEDLEEKDKEEVEENDDYINSKQIETALDSLEIVGNKKANSTHTIKAKGKSKNGVLYQFYVKDLNSKEKNKWTIVQSYSEKTEANWTPKANGDYWYGVHIKDKNSDKSLDTHQYIPITIGSAEETALDSLEIIGNKKANSTHTIKAKGRSKNGVLYQFYVKDLNSKEKNKWTIVQSYSEKTEANWTPKANGDYWYGVHIKDKNSDKSLDAHQYIPITIGSAKETTLESFQIEGNLEVESNQVLKAKASSINNPLYQFYIKDLSTNKWTVIQDYSVKNTATWKPQKPGSYWYGVHVKDAKSSKKLDTHLYTNVEIKPVPPAVLEDFKISGRGYEKERHILSAKAKSRNGVLYQFYVKDLKTNKWTVIQEYSEKTTANWEPANPGKYWYGVHIKDKKSTSRQDAHLYKDFTISPIVSYKVSNYNDTIEEALDKQVGRNTISKNGKWVPATKEEIREYLDADRFLQFKPEGNGEEKHLPSIEITVDSLNVRQEPNTSSSVLGTVKKGEVYIVLDEKGNWYQINAAGKKGWVSKDYAEVINDVPREMYQFMVLSGQAGVGVGQMNLELKGQGILQGKGAAFIEGSRKYNVNELYLMAHAFLETGRGTSQLANGVRVSEVDGKPVTPRTVYNMYGIGAYDATALKSGSERAYKEGWFTPELAITEGAHWISNNYINHPTYKQDTLYKMKFNPATPGTHQYATDIAWAFKQTRQIDIMMDLYKKIDGALLRFDIPKYR